MKLVILLSLAVAPLRADARLGDGSHAVDELGYDYDEALRPPGR